MNWLDDLKTLKLPPLAAGPHKTPDEGLCAMEMVAYTERLPHSDAPACTCPIITACVTELNDALPQEHRERLKLYLPRLVGTVSTTHKDVRNDLWIEAWSVEWGCKPAYEVAKSANGIDKLFELLDRMIEAGPSGGWTDYSTERARELESVGQGAE